MTAPEHTIDAVDVPALERRCGRCRGSFAADPALDPRTMQEWWACDACRLVLFPIKSAPAAHAAITTTARGQIDAQ
jgi:hypothetical protein